MAEYYSSLLQAFIDWTDQEIENGKKFLDWNEVSIQWQNIDIHWEDIFILLERKKGGSSGSGDPYRGEVLKRYVEGNPWKQARKELGEEKAENLVKVFCTINGIDYKSIHENKENIRIVVNEFIRENDDKKISVKIKL